MPRRHAPLNARNADPRALYETAVQQPRIIIGFLEDLFDELFPDHPHPAPAVLREDFCGTAYLSTSFVHSDPKRRAIAIDVDAQPLDWARHHHLQSMSDNDAKRLTLIENDVMRVRGKRADVVASLNFSHFIYKSRSDLLAYFRHARARLKSEGLLLIDAFGGPASMTPGTDNRRFGDFTYQWQQASFNPITHDITCHIHFRFPNGSMLRKAFTYDWRMWTLPELQELLLEAGFSQIGVYFEGEDGFIADPDDLDMDAWVAYLVALKTKAN